MAAKTGNPLVDDFGLEEGSWVHIWNHEDKKYLSSCKIKNVDNNTITLDDDGSVYTYHDEKDNAHWTDETGAEFMMSFGGSPEEDKNDIGILEYTEAGYQLPPWHNGRQNAGAGGKQ